jgi:hypothetical protein
MEQTGRLPASVANSSPYGRPPLPQVPVPSHPGHSWPPAQSSSVPRMPPPTHTPPAPPPSLWERKIDPASQRPFVSALSRLILRNPTLISAPGTTSTPLLSSPHGSCLLAPFSLPRRRIVTRNQRSPGLPQLKKFSTSLRTSLLVTPHLFASCLTPVFQK